MQVQEAQRPAPRIPLELILLVIDLVEDTATLATLALTCKMITTEAERRLYSSFTKKSHRALAKFCFKVWSHRDRKAGFVRRLDTDSAPPSSRPSESLLKQTYQYLMLALPYMINLTELNLDLEWLRVGLLINVSVETVMSQVADATFQLRNFRLHDTSRSSYAGIDLFLVKQPALQQVDLPHFIMESRHDIAPISLPNLLLLKAPTNFLMAILPHTKNLQMLVWRATAERFDPGPYEIFSTISTQFARIRYLSYGEFPELGGENSSSKFCSIAPYLGNLECLELCSFSVEEQVRALERLPSPEKLRMLLFHPLPLMRMQNDIQTLNLADWIFLRLPSLRFFAVPVFSWNRDCERQEIEGYRIFDSAKGRSADRGEPVADAFHKITNSDLLHHHIFELLPH
ncbi:hypothetical protein CPC08DRAFT_707867 [Agrocybe pediades]|nr:hypothetical protein CPC08DRAFT_707867 [Agrocybe pediades]